MHDENTIEATRWRAVRELGKAREAAETNLRRVTELHERAEEAVRNDNRREVGEWARGILDDTDTRLLALGTTGLHDPVDVVEVAVLDVDGQTLVNLPVRPAAHGGGGPIEVEDGAAALHGHTTADLADAPIMTEVYPRLREILEGRRVVVYNDEYVERVLSQTFERYGLEEPLEIRIECAMRAYSRLEGTWSLTDETYSPVKLPDADGTPMGNADALLELLKRLAGRSPVSSGSGGRGGRRGEDHDINSEDFEDIPFKARFPARVRYPLI